MCIRDSISGGGRTLLNIREQIRLGRLNAKIECVISSRGDVKGVQRSRDAGLKTILIDRKTCLPDAFQDELTRAVTAAQVDLVCMAGFLSLWRIPNDCHGKVINIHPALLPDFGGPGMYGHRVHEAVLASGRAESGCTIHFCDNEYDHGPIILQKKVPVLPSDTPDTLAARVFEQECIAYPEAIQLFADNRVRLEGNLVTIVNS